MSIKESFVLLRADAHLVEAWKATYATVYHFRSSGGTRLECESHLTQACQRPGKSLLSALRSLKGKKRFFSRIMKEGSSMNGFAQGYREALEWLHEGDALDGFEKAEAFAPGSLENLEADCLAFERENKKALDVIRSFKCCTEGRLGFCFYLSRNGHGSGFFDEHLNHDLTDPTKRAKLQSIFALLQEAARDWPESYEEIGDDLLIHYPATKRKASE